MPRGGLVFCGMPSLVGSGFQSRRSWRQTIGQVAAACPELNVKGRPCVPRCFTSAQICRCDKRLRTAKRCLETVAPRRFAKLPSQTSRGRATGHAESAGAPRRAAARRGVPRHIGSGCAAGEHRSTLPTAAHACALELAANSERCRRAPCLAVLGARSALIWGW
jgi:hypothetical protein